jgi:hypothetical protein
VCSCGLSGLKSMMVSTPVEGKERVLKLDNRGIVNCRHDGGNCSNVVVPSLLLNVNRRVHRC